MGNNLKLIISLMTSSLVFCFCALLKGRNALGDIMKGLLVTGENSQLRCEKTLIIKRADLYDHQIWVCRASVANGYSAAWTEMPDHGRC